MQKRTLILFPFILFITATTAISQNNWPKTFLWRISGNGLTKDSYLYGTMHLQDKRLFNFGDSLYRYLEKAEGYALEIDLTEMMDSLFQRIIDERSSYRVDEDQIANAKNKKKYIDSLIANVKEYKDKNSRKILQSMRDARMNSVLRTEMPTMMDAFLYGIARRQGKWLGGIEDLQDQLPILDELGGEITREDLLGSDKELRSSLEKMISIYLQRDLNKVESYYLKDRYDELKDYSLIKRNIKMASRMDSLAHARTMFFTVGVAHLPGDSGVITLLRKKGFRLDPVFSTNDVDPMQYVSTLKSVEWEKSEDANKTYEIEMPGKSSEIGIASGLVKMKYFVDLSTLTFFVTNSTVVAENMNLDNFVENAAKSQNAVLISKKNIELKGVKGIETYISTNQYYFKTIYLLRGHLLYMLFVGGQKKETINSPDADHFIASFTPSKELPVASKKTWKRFEVGEKGCSILFPGEAQQNPKMAQGVINNWNFSTYDFADPVTGTYYILQVRDIIPGMHIPSDSSIFITFRERLSNSIKAATLNEESYFNGYPVLKYEGIGANGAIFKSRIINRGNRCYYVIVEGQSAALTDMENFQQSFTMLDYEPKDWNKQESGSGNFHTLAPVSFTQVIDTTSTLDEKDRPIHFVSYDTADCTSYEVLKLNVSPYYSTQSDTTFFDDIGAAHVKQGDSLLSQKWVTNGNLKGQEWVVQSPGNNLVRKSRYLLNGDTLYYITCYLPVQRAGDATFQRFFTNFRVISEDLNYNIYKSKTEKILTDLQSKDPVLFSEASSAFSTAKFIDSDKTLLEEALVKEYRDDDSIAYNARDRIIDSLASRMDNKTVDFIRKTYPNLTGKREFMKMGLIDLLARHQTKYSFDALKDILLTYPPRATGAYVLSKYVDDSLELTKSLYPEILQLSNDPIFVMDVMGLTSVMLEKEMVPLSMVEQYRKYFINSADTIYDNKVRSGIEISGNSYIKMLNLMQQLNDQEGNRILKKYLNAADLDIKQSSILGLLRNGQLVDPKGIEKVAADKAYRNYFYTQLHEIGKASLFPATFTKQQSMAEADIYTYSIDEHDYTPDALNYIGVKTIRYQGKNYQMHLFRVVYEYVDDDGNKKKEIYLGVSGPFSMDPKEIMMDSELTKIFFDEEYDAKKTQKLLLDYIKSMEEVEESLIK
jgi:uncharacterized protein YbaP (TraB family)